MLALKLSLFISLLLLTACNTSLSTAWPSAQAPENNADKIAVVITGWGEPKGFDFGFRMALGRAQNGERKISRDQACTENFVGKWPFVSQIGLIPFSVAYQVPKLEAAYDSLGVYRKEGEDYVSIVDSTVRLRLADIPDVDGIIKPVSESNFFPGRSIGAIDPRDGRNLLEGLYQIGETSRKRGKNPLRLANGISDFDEIRMVASMADMFFMYQDMEPRANHTDESMTKVAMEVVKGYFGDKVDLRFGAYAATEGIFPAEEDVAMDYYNAGFRKFILTRETTDNNNYANNFMTRGIIDQRLCKEGVLDQVTIKQTRQVGRTPEYNTALLEILRPHLESRQQGSDVTIIYTTYGMPFPGGNDRGPFAVAHPLVADVYHENAYLNYQSFKRYANAEFGGEFNLQFNHNEAVSDKRTDSYYAYAMFPSNFYGKPNDPLRFPTIRENIDRAKTEGRREVIVLLSHWNYNNTDNMLGMRNLNKIPFNSRDEVDQGKYWKDWCERVDSYQPVACDGEGEDLIRISFTEVFDKQAEAFGIGYGNRIRGTVERYGLLPPGIEVIARTNISAEKGGALAVRSGVLAGVKLEVAADPAPAKPEIFRYNKYEAFVDPARPFTSAWFDFEAYIATQDLSKGLAKNLVGPPVLIGPYRTIVNKPARITLPFDKTKVTATQTPMPVIYNEVSGRWDPVYDVAGGTANTVDRERATLSFDAQVLGLFSVVVQ